MILDRAVSDAILAQDFKSCRELFAWPAREDTSERSDGLAAFGEDDARDLQTRIVTKHIVAFCRVEDPKGATTAEADAKKDAAAKLELFLACFFDAGKPSLLLDRPFANEVEKLMLVLRAPKVNTDESFAAAETASQSLLQNKAGIFHRVLTLFSTGIYINREANDFFCAGKSMPGTSCSSRSCANR